MIELLSEKLYSPTMGAGAAVSFQHPGAALGTIAEHIADPEESAVRKLRLGAELERGALPRTSRCFVAVPTFGCSWSEVDMPRASPPCRSDEKSPRAVIGRPKTLQCSRLLSPP